MYLSIQSAALAVTILQLAGSARAVVSSCSSSDVCYALSIPETTANSGDGDIYFQLSAPTSYQYVALGQGSAMAGSNMFVMYTSSNGNNVTISPRLGTGYSMPEYTTSTNIDLLDGSGVVNDVMTANVRCRNCQNWDGGSMDFSASSATWIYAEASGSALDSDDLDASISQHQSASSFTFDLSQARGGSADVNPFTSSSEVTETSESGVPSTCTPITSVTGMSASGEATFASSSTGAGESNTACPTSWPPSSSPSTSYPAECFGKNPSSRWRGRPTGSTIDTRKSKQKRDDGCPAGYEASTVSTSNGAGGENAGDSGGFSSTGRLILVHGVLASLAFVGFFPIGGILIRIGNITGLMWIHVALQSLATVTYLAAFGVGVYLATQFRLLGTAHPVIGIVLLIKVVLQPASGWLHHSLFKKYQHRTLWSYFHLWGGRTTILLGMVNGGLGLSLAQTGRGAIIAYSVVAGVVGVVYITAAILGERRRKNTHVPARHEKSQRNRQMEDSSSTEESMWRYDGGERGRGEHYSRHSRSH